MLHKDFSNRMPELETARVRLRALKIEDAPALNIVNRHPEVMRFIGPIEQTVETTERYLQRGPLADYANYGFGRHACIDKASNQLIGFCGLKYLPDLNEVDIGYRFLPQYWGKGLASETSKVFMQHAQKVIGLKRIIGLALPENAGSINVLKKLGMRFEKRVVSQGDECVLYAWGTEAEAQPVPLFAPPVEAN